MILVAAGDYDSFVIADKALDIEADGAPCTVTGGITVTSLEAGKTVVVRGIDALRARPDLTAALRIQSCTGAVHVEGGSFVGSSESAISPPFPGATIAACAAGLAPRCRIVGGKTLITSMLEAGAGLEVSAPRTSRSGNCSCGGESNYALDGSPAPGASMNQQHRVRLGQQLLRRLAECLHAVCSPGADGPRPCGRRSTHLLNERFFGGAARHGDFLHERRPAGLPLHADAASGSTTRCCRVRRGSSSRRRPCARARASRSLSTASPQKRDPHGLSLQRIPLGGRAHGTFLARLSLRDPAAGTTERPRQLQLLDDGSRAGARRRGLTLSCQGFFYVSGANKSVGPIRRLLLDSGTDA